jgi:hypothetical protein
MKKRKWTGNRIKELIIKCLLVIGFILQITGLFGAVALNHFGYETLALWGIFVGVGLPVLIGLTIFIMTFTFKEDEWNNKDYKIKYYECALEEPIESRMQVIYDEVKHSEINPENFYSTYHKENEVVVVAVMYVDSFFNEDEYVNYMNEIPEVNEKILCHTLVVIFLEKEKSSYLKEIMYVPEYNSLWDTKVFSVYDTEKKKLKVNKTNSETGNKAYNDARKELNKIFSFVKKVKYYIYIS